MVKAGEKVLLLPPHTPTAALCFLLFEALTWGKVLLSQQTRSDQPLEITQTGSGIYWLRQTAASFRFTISTPGKDRNNVMDTGLNLSLIVPT